MTEMEGLCSLRLRAPCEWEGVVYEAVGAVRALPIKSGRWRGGSCPVGCSAVLQENTVAEPVRPGSLPAVYACRPGPTLPCAAPALPRAVLTANETAAAEALVEVAVEEANRQAEQAAATWGDGNYTGAPAVVALSCGGSLSRPPPPAEALPRCPHCPAGRSCFAAPCRASLSPPQLLRCPHPSLRPPARCLVPADETGLVQDAGPVRVQTLEGGEAGSSGAAAAKQQQQKKHAQPLRRRLQAAAAGLAASLRGMVAARAGRRQMQEEVLTGASSGGGGGSAAWAVLHLACTRVPRLPNNQQLHHGPPTLNLLVASRPQTARCWAPPSWAATCPCLRWTPRCCRRWWTCCCPPTTPLTSWRTTSSSGGVAHDLPRLPCLGCLACAVTALAVL